MKLNIFSLLLFISIVFADPKGKKISKKSKLITLLTKPFYKLPFLDQSTTTTPSPMPVKCDVIWEEKVTPLCKTKHNKVCKPDWKEECKTEWAEECWDEPVEKCKSVKQCHTTQQNVCKTEYTIECEDAHEKKWKRSTDEALLGYDEESEALDQPEIGEASLDDAGRSKRAIIKDKKKFKKLLPKLAVKALLGETQTTTATTAKETLCHHHPHTSCWDEPVEKCVDVPECHTEQKQRCKKVPKKVCSKVETQKCWDEPEEVCEYMRVKVAKKHCRKPKQW